MILRQSILSRSVPTAREHRSAALVLGERHPLPKALARHRTVTHQTIVAIATAPAAALAALAHIAVGPVFLGVSVLVGLGFVAVWSSTGRTVVDRVHELIAGGAASLRLPVVVRERQRLASRKERERLARSLEHALDEVWNISRLPARSRALQGLICLRDATPEARAVIQTLRCEQVSVRGVAMAAQLLMDGQRSALYSGDRRRLREELGRIRFALESTEESEELAHGQRAAA